MVEVVVVGKERQEAVKNSLVVPSDKGHNVLSHFNPP